MKKIAIIALVFSASAGALAQSFPAKPVRLVVAFPAGGGVDIVARLLSPKLAEAWGQQVIVDNRAGASGVIGTEFAARSAPDGPELIALARSRPGQLNYSSSGPGGAPHLAGELFKSMAKVDLVHVPYKGSAPSFQDLLGAQVSLTFDSLVQALPYIRDGRLRALAVLGAARTPLLPDVPTVAESLPGYELTNWFGLVAPAAVPRAVIARIHADVVRVLQDAGVSAKLSAMGATAVGNTPEQFGRAMRADSEKWGRLIREANIRAE